MKARAWVLALGCTLSATVCAAGAPAVTEPAIAALTPPAATVAGTRSGREIYLRFREGLADAHCEPGVSTRWRAHFAHAPKLLAARGGEGMALFGYVVDALREAHLPTEFALIPFVESGYDPGARSAAGPAGLWQFIAVTARNHKIPMRAGYDGRLSPADSTRAAVRYLKTLHGMFAGDWRLAVMAFNAGEYRVLAALKRHGQRAMDARPEALTSLPGITQSYVRKLHALSCAFGEAEHSADWARLLDRQIPVLTARELASGRSGSLEAVAVELGTDAAALRRLNPALAAGLAARGGEPLRALVPITEAAAATPAATGGDAVVDAVASAPISAPVVDAAVASAAISAPAAAPAPGPSPSPAADSTPAQTVAPAISPRVHTVARGESVWVIARRYGLSTAQLLARNGLQPRSVLRPGMVLKLDAGDSELGALIAPVAN